MPARRMVVVRLTLDDRSHCRGTAMADSGQEAPFDGWLELLGAVAHLIDDPGLDPFDQP
ncbi:hypothetical protein [Egibacter rhizosphaerae]|uniref:hypothetical protein n=1 Tax=Egibacter rhizosphaerae TaxID=1670831 RepID=UPI0013F15657|nr:hypothetical protein [Egibacter rhizosphaerae]